METVLMTSKIQLTHHAKLRTKQRGIKEDEVYSVLQYGRKIFRQGLKFFYLPKSSIKHKNLKCDFQTSSLIVITDDLEKEIITCYKNDNGIHHIKKKSKRLAIY